MQYQDQFDFKKELMEFNQNFEKENRNMDFVQQNFMNRTNIELYKQAIDAFVIKVKEESKEQLNMQKQEMKMMEQK